MYVDVTLIVDVSGSMAGIASEASEGINKLVEDQKALPGKCVLSLVEFDSEAVVTAIPPTVVQSIESKYQLRARGLTPLYDAVVDTIDALGKRLAALPETERPNRVLVAIMTDGEENYSRRHTKADVAARISHQQEKYSWEFMFLGANFDAFAEGQSLGVVAAATATYTPDSVGAAYSAVSKAVMRSRSGGDFTLTEEERRSL